MKKELTTYNESVLDPFFDFFAPSLFDETKYTRGLSMRTDIKEDEKNYILEVELPGIEKNDISVTLNEGYLTIKAQADRESSEKDKKNNFLHRERFSGVASRSYYVGDVDEKAIQASFNNGVLTLTIPKTAQTKAQIEHKIEIK